MEYVEKYGEDNAEYLIEVEKSWTQHYSLAALIEWPELMRDEFDGFTRQAARSGNLEYLRLTGKDTILKKLVFGQWDDDFLRVGPGQKTVYSADEQLITAE